MREERNNEDEIYEVVYLFSLISFSVSPGNGPLKHYISDVVGTLKGDLDPLASRREVSLAFKSLTKLLELKTSALYIRLPYL